VVVEEKVNKNPESLEQVTQFTYIVNLNELEKDLAIVIVHKQEREREKEGKIERGRLG
jgi:hypothetical protein